MDEKEVTHQKLRIESYERLREALSKIKADIDALEKINGNHNELRKLTRFIGASNRENVGVQDIVLSSDFLTTRQLALACLPILKDERTRLEKAISDL